MADDPKEKSPLDEARAALRRAREEFSPGLKVAGMVLKPAARAAKRVAWNARRAVQIEKLHDKVNKALGLDARHEVAVDGTVYRIAKISADLYEARTVSDDRVVGRFSCDAEKRLWLVESDDGDARAMLLVAEAAMAAGVAP